MNSVDIIVPVFNEEHMIDYFYNKVNAVLTTCDVSFHIYFIDDGSSDQTFVKIKQLYDKDQRIRAIKLSRNFGKEIALTAGLHCSTGDAVIIIDVDLQDPPELIPQMIDKWREGYPVVLAKRSSRKFDNIIKVVTASLFYLVINIFSRIKIPKNVGDFRLIDKEVVSVINQMPEKTRFMKGLFAWVGFESFTIDYQRTSRVKGKTKFSYWKLWNLALQGITSFSDIFIKLSSYFGFSIIACSFFYGLFLIIRTLKYGVDVPGYASLMVVVLVINGIILMILGIMGEYISRIFIEVKNRPLFVISHKLGLD